MSILERIKGIEAEPQTVNVGIIGQGQEAKRLCEAYANEKRTSVIAEAPAQSADEVIRTPGLSAVEIIAPLENRAGIAKACIEAGLFTSVAAPISTSLAQSSRLVEMAREYGTGLRVRAHSLYYDPYIQARKLLDERAIGRLITLKLLVRRGRGTTVPEPFDPFEWIVQEELGYLALAQYLGGSMTSVHARLEAMTDSAVRPSSVLMWRYKPAHQMGYLQLDICPDLHVRSFTDPVHRHIEITGTDGIIFITRGEGQLMRMPVLMVRAGSTTTVHEMVKDEWSEIYPALASETVECTVSGKSPRGKPELCISALRLALAGKLSRDRQTEVSVDDIQHD